MVVFFCPQITVLLSFFLSSVLSEPMSEVSINSKRPCLPVHLDF